MTHPRRRRLALAAALLLLLAAGPDRALAQNSLYVTNLGSYTVGEYNADTGAAVNASFIASGLSAPLGVTFAGGNLYTANNNASTITASDATTGAPAAGFTTINNVAYPWDVLAGNSLLYVSGTNGTVSAYNPATGAVAPGFASISGLGNARGLAVTGTTLYVSTLSAVRSYDALTGQLLNATFITGLSDVNFLKALGNILYASSDDGNLKAFNATTGTAQPGFTTINTASPSFTGLEGMQIVGNNLLVAEYDANRVSEFDATTGALINANYITGLNGPIGLALGAVPEPSAWAALALGGAGLLGLSLRHRRAHWA